MDDRNMAAIIRLLERELEKKELPVVTKLSEEHRDPFEILISTLLSLRTKDEVTAAATERLFALASTPEEMVALSEEEILAYAASGEPMDKAGAYAIQGLASKFIDRIEGCYFNVVGLPVSMVYRFLKEAGYPFPVR